MVKNLKYPKLPRRKGKNILVQTISREDPALIFEFKKDHPGAITADQGGFSDVNSRRRWDLSGYPRD